MIEADLQLIGSEDVSIAKEAMDRVLKACDRYLRSVLRKKGFSVQDIEDTVAETAARIWEKRMDFRDMGLAAFRRFQITVAKNWTLNQRAKQRADISLDEIESLSGARKDLVETMAFSNILLGQVGSLADELWLEIEPDTPDWVRNRDLLAAQYFYLHGEPWEKILSRANRVRPSQPITRSDLDMVLTKPGVLRNVCYIQLYIDNEELAHYLIGESGILIGAYDLKLSETAIGFEREVILHRFRDGFSLEQIQMCKTIALSKHEIADIINNQIAKLPYNSIMQHLLGAMSCIPNLDKTLAQPGLWKRLIFQYWELCNLTHQDIRERCDPPAKLVGYSITLGQLNGWLSKERLLNALRLYASRRGKI
ncbi:MAG TPA: hypothetical protein VGL56_18215 [Fimbriimonadaceae bacterium]|jgi:DNA-directed RNA polymerase specialized sigma24 family protein